MTPQWAMYSRSMAMSDAHASEREPEASPGDAGRPVVRGARLAGRQERQRHDVDDRETRRGRTPIDHQRDPVQRGRGRGPPATAAG